MDNSQTSTHFSHAKKTDQPYLTVKFQIPHLKYKDQLLFFLIRDSIVLRVPVIKTQHPSSMMDIFLYWSWLSFHLI